MNNPWLHGWLLLLLISATFVVLFSIGAIGMLAYRFLDWLL